MNNLFARNLIIGLIVIFSASLNVNAAVVKSLLPSQEYNPEIPTPEEYLGYELGDWHVRHDQIIAYFKLLAEKSTNISFEVYGKSWEQKPQVVLIATSKANQQQLAKIKQQRHSPLAIDNQSPLVVWLGYSIHGNEASGTNASLAVAYHLAASKDSAVKEFLKNAVILIDPSFNPDGYSRFSNWVNANKSLMSNGDTLDRELNEIWPGSRSNHYWFDLNRDWLLAINPESKNRLNLFHQWHPHIVTDHHEMGSDSSYFFQPGVPLRQNPLTPKANFELTSQLAKFHAETFDRQGRRYFTKEYFDDYYIGKGSTYPDVNGSIGILFEQASVRGHLRQTINGMRRFDFAIKNHVSTSLSTLTGAAKIQQDLLNYQNKFFKNQQRSKSAVVFSRTENPSRSKLLVEYLQLHHINVYHLKKPISNNGKTIKHGFVVPMNQPHGKLVDGIFDVRTKFKDTTFYDVSAWSMQYAFDLSIMKVKNLSSSYQGNLLNGHDLNSAKNIKTLPQNANIIAAVFEWKYDDAAKMTAQLLTAGLQLHVNKKPFSINMKNSKTQNFREGQIIVSLTNSQQQAILSQLSQRYKIPLFAITTRLSSTGIDLGSPNMKKLSKPRIGLLTGSGFSGYQAGEVRYVVEQKLGLPVTVLNTSQINSKSLNQYSHLVLVDGDYQSKTFFSKQKKYNPIVSWVKNGGSLIAFEGAAKWVTSWEDVEAEMEKTTKNKEIAKRQDFSVKEKQDAVDIIGGAIFANDLDPTNPLGYGYSDREIASFKTSNYIFTKTKGPYDSVSVYTEKPLLSGYSSPFNLEKIANTPMLVREKLADGEVILFADNPNFRGYWLATMGLFTNSLYFAGIH